MNTWKEAIIQIIEILTEDKTLAMLCLSSIGIFTIIKFPIDDSLSVLTAIISGVAGFVTGSVTKR